VLYHLLVALRSRGVGLDAVMAELETAHRPIRHCRKGKPGSRMRDGHAIWDQLVKSTCRPIRCSRAGNGPVAGGYADDADGRRARPPCARSTTRSRWRRSRMSICRCRACCRFTSPATQGLHRATQSFLGTTRRQGPLSDRGAGSVAVGKSTTARVLRQLLTRWPQHAEGRPSSHRRLPVCNAFLRENGLMERKGFPRKL